MKKHQVSLLAVPLFTLGCGQPTDPAKTTESTAKPAVEPEAEAVAQPAATKPAAKEATRGAAKPAAKGGKKAKAKPAEHARRPNLNENKALAVLSDANSTLEDKAMACDRLGAIGTAKAVPALAALVTDPKLGDYARDGLERIPDAAIGEALIAAVDKAKGQELTSPVITLGDRGEEAAVPALKKFAAGKDKALADAALSSLSLIANDDAAGIIVSVLEKSQGKTRIAAAHAALRVADRNADVAEKLRKAVAGADVPDHIKAAAGK